MSYTRDSIKKFVQDNINSLIDDGVIAGRVIEQMVAKKNNWKNVGGNNFSYDHVDEDGNKIETKSTRSIQLDRYLRIGGMGNKKNCCDIMQIIDTISGREFRIPHDIFYKRARFDNNQFWWSCNYDTNIRSYVKSINTELLLEHEVLQ